MESFDYLIVGGGIAGTTAAETLRKESPEASIAIVSDEPYPLYSRILLSKPGFFLGKIPFGSVWMRRPEWYAEQRIELLSGRRAVELAADSNRLALDDGTSLGYGQLLLAVGCPARRLDVSGLAGKSGVGYMKTLDDARDLMANIKSAKRAVVVGAGFVGFEMCDVLLQAGLEVESVVRESYFWEPVLDRPAGELVGQAMEMAGVSLHLEAELAEVLGQDSVEGVRLKDGTEIACQLLLIGAGVQFDGGWLARAGVSVSHGIVTDEHLRTSRDGVWAAGDVAELNDPSVGENFMCGTWLDAQEQGRTAALNMLGRELPYRTASPYSAHGFGLALTFVGRLRCGSRQLFPRGSVESGSYGAVAVQDGRRVVGAFLINRGTELAAIRALIESGTDVSGRLAELSDLESDLSSFLPK
ncbi:MAG: FAD-dependent oxidoreductase [bacterium]